MRCCSRQCKSEGQTQTCPFLSLIGWSAFEMPRQPVYWGSTDNRLQSSRISDSVKGQARPTSQRAAWLPHTTSFPWPFHWQVIGSIHILHQTNGERFVQSLITCLWLRYKNSDSIITRSTSSSNSALPEVRGRSWRSPAHAHNHMLLWAFQGKGNLSKPALSKLGLPERLDQWWSPKAVTRWRPAKQNRNLHPPPPALLF